MQNSLRINGDLLYSLYPQGVFILFRSLKSIETILKEIPSI